MKMIIAFLLALFVSACGYHEVHRGGGSVMAYSQPPVWEAGKNHRGPLARTPEFVEGAGFQVYPALSVEVVNATSEKIAVRCGRDDEHVLAPGETRRSTFFGPRREEICLAFALDKRDRKTGGFDSRKYRTPTKGLRQEIWKVRRIRPPE